MHYFYFSSKRLSPPQQLSSMAAINPAQPSDQRIILYDMYMLVTQSAQLKTSCARPKTVFLVAAVSPPPPLTRWVLRHINFTSQQPIVVAT